MELAASGSPSPKAFTTTEQVTGDLARAQRPGGPAAAGNCHLRTRRRRRGWLERGALPRARPKGGVGGTRRGGSARKLEGQSEPSRGSHGEAEDPEQPQGRAPGALRCASGRW